ncbi:MAG: hypothetical protein HWN66_01410 [Candidatus Helarchaeota archaeon]|nr:hypothetical protein [Candidatus Helarchaeota archaeon]
MLDDLAKLFEKIDLIWCDNPGKEIQKSDNYQNLLVIFPNLKQIHQEVHKTNLFEFNRTMRHIFRSLKIYYLLKQEAFTYQSLSNTSLKKLKGKIEKNSVFKFYLPIILIYHDIGRFIDRKTHTYQSSNLILKNNLLDCFELSEIEKLLLRKIIEYHLLLATIYTGESTFFGILSLLNDKEFIDLISFEDRKYAGLFVDLLEVFTYLDVLGYPYSRIFDHYLKYYEEINKKLKNLLALWPNLDEIISRAKDYSFQWTDWRLANALRVFQFVETTPHLTREFYFNVLKESIRPECDKRGINFNWNSMKNEYLSNIYKLQLKYGLPLLMLLAFGEFKRFQLKEHQTIPPKLLLFWILLANEIKKRGLDNEEVVWNIYFEKIPFWSEITKRFTEKLEMSKLKSIVNHAIIQFDEKRREYALYLDFGELID